MAKQTPFRTDSEEEHQSGFDVPPALVINPAAEPRSLLAALKHRSNMLHSSLRAWGCVDPEHGSVTASEIVEICEPLAQEVDMLVDELTRKLDLAKAL
jgi:hypothetical protein